MALGSVVGLPRCGSDAGDAGPSKIPAPDRDAGADGGSGGGGNAPGLDGGGLGGGFNIGGAGGQSGGGSSTGGFGGTFDACGDAGCPEGTFCKFDLCLPDRGDCDDNDGCPGDSYCDSDGVCLPYGVPEDVTNDPSCQRADAPTGVAPVEQCEWTGADDDTRDYERIYTAPMVADLNLDLDANRLQPSIVATTWAERNGERVGILRIFDGRTCAEQARAGTADDSEDPDRPAYASQLAIGDLDGDVGTPNGHPEIVGLHRVEGDFGGSHLVTPIAWEIDSSVDPPVLRTRWKGRVCGATPDEDEPVEFGSHWLEFGPGLWDLDDDGTPEIVIDRLVFDADGCLLNPPPASDHYTVYLASGDNHKGVISTVADVDLDGSPELVRYDGVYAWESGDWQKEAYSNPSGAAAKAGHVAVADLGEYSTLSAAPDGRPLPEIIVVSAEGDFDPNSTGSVRAMTLAGDVVFGPVPLFSSPGEPGGHGGPPTASDFDGDGQVEFAAAANEFYTVYDPDCAAGGVPAERPGGACDRSDITPPMGLAAHPDDVLWARVSSDYSSSQTGSSIFDFNGDGASEAVYGDECYLRVYDGRTGTVLFSAPASSGTGSELPVVADVDGDFATEVVVARTPRGGCDDPDPLFPESGSFQQKAGFVILRDPEDRWVSSRPIWNQHAYSVTHVTDDARIPRSSDVENNWEVEGLNNFRQNVQGELDRQALADLTVELANLDGLCAGKSGSIDVAAQVCNRGTNPVQDGALVAFFARAADEPNADGKKLCEVATETLLDVGDCTVVECTGDLDADHDVFVVVDPDGEIADCHPGNNDAAGSLVVCQGFKFQ